MAKCLLSNSIHISFTTSILTTKIALAKDFSQYKLEQGKYVPLNHYGVMNPLWTTHSSSYASCQPKNTFFRHLVHLQTYTDESNMTLHIQDDLMSQVKESLTLLTHDSIFHRDLSEIPIETLIEGHVQ